MRRGLNAALLAAAIVATGCGASSTKTTATGAAASSTPTQTAGITKAEFIARADPICRAGNANVNPLLERARAMLNSESSPTKGVALVRQAVAVQRTYLAQLEALPRPSADKSTLSKWLMALNESVTAGTKLADSIASENAQGVKAATEAGARAKTLSHGIAHGYGFKVCGAGK